MVKDENTLMADAIEKLDAYMDSVDPKKKKLLAYWIQDYVRFLKKEESFDPQQLIRYKRGAVVKAHLGYRIGSEEGGLHYAVVMDVQTSQKSPVVTVIPLTSVKPGKDIERLHPSQVYLGDEIYQSLSEKLDNAIVEIEEIRQSLILRLEKMIKDEKASSESDTGARRIERRVSMDLLEKELEVWERKRYHAQKMSDEIGTMKRGSIALVGQITTISKIRIYDPLYPTDTLSKIRLSDNSLTKLDEKIKNLFTKSI